MDKTAIATALISSIIALISAVITPFVCMGIQKKSERREIHRALLNKYISQLGELNYSLLSCLKIFPKTKTDESRKKWRDALEETKVEINQIRLKLRYPLWGIVDEIRTLALTASWGQHYLDNQVQFEKFYHLANNLREELDKAILDSYNNGKPPHKKYVTRVKNAAMMVKSFHEKTNPLKDQYKDLIKSEDGLALVSKIQDDVSLKILQQLQGSK